MQKKPFKLSRRAHFAFRHTACKIRAHSLNRRNMLNYLIFTFAYSLLFFLSGRRAQFDHIAHALFSIYSSNTTKKTKMKSHNGYFTQFECFDRFLFNRMMEDVAEVNLRHFLPQFYYFLFIVLFCQCSFVYIRKRYDVAASGNHRKH